MDDLTEARFSLVDDRIEHLRERIEALEGEDRHAEGMRLNWIVVVLFVAELLMGGWQLWWAMHHA